MYRCAACGAELFSSDTKFESGTGWPSFTEPEVAEAVELRHDRSWGMDRTEVVCRKCGGHLGHVFDDGPREAGGDALLHQLLRARPRQELTARDGHARHEHPPDRPRRRAGGARGRAGRRRRRAAVARVPGRRVRASARRACWPSSSSAPTSGGALVLTGDCVELGESELPYVPLVAALRPLARSGDPALTGRVPRAPVAPLLPGLGPAAPSAHRRSGRRARRAQARLFEGLLSLLDGLGRGEPVLLLIEDLHWADRSTRAALAFLARSLGAERVLVVATYRPGRAAPPPPAATAAGRARARPARPPASTLAPLTRDELADQLADILGAPPEAELLDRLWTRSGGNPLFTEELLAAGLDGRGAAAGHAARRADAAGRAAARAGPGGAAARRRRPAADHALLAETSGLERARCATRCARRSTATSWSPTTRAATASATRCCARSSTTTCCRASGPRCTWRSRARSSARRRAGRRAG